ncbi:MAG: APC family permease [Planctomycetota bacterium]|nr:APC family permease [Planctomycetota bacterium]
MSTAERPQLKRVIGRLGFFSLAFGSMIGVGWITSLGNWFEKAGPLGAITAFLVGGLVMLVIGLCYAEVTPMLPVAGGEVAYAYKASGTSMAFVVGWCLALGYLSVSAFEAGSIGVVLAYIEPRLEVGPLYSVNGVTVFASHLAIAAVFTLFITVINFVGVNVATRVQVGLTILLVICASAFVIAGFGQGSTQNLRPGFVGETAFAGFQGILAVLVTVPFWFVGFDTIPQAAEERQGQLPARRLSQCIVMSILGSILFYVAVITTVGVVTPWQTIVGAKLPTARAFETAFESRLWVNLVLMVGLIGLLTSWNGFFLAGTRVLFALGRAHIIHPAFGRTHAKFGTPTTAVVFSGVVTLFSAGLGKGALIAFVDAGSLGIVLAFVGVALSLVKLRRSFPHLPRPYRVPGGWILPVAAMIGSLLLLLVMVVPGSPGSLTGLEWVIVAGFLCLGVVFWFAARATRARLTETERGRLILEDYA